MPKKTPYIRNKTNDESYMHMYAKCLTKQFNQPGKWLGTLHCPSFHGKKGLKAERLVAGKR
jgi:hypothetical protein